MSLPTHTTVLIVGGGPTGVAAALSLLRAGVQDLLIVDAINTGENTSRAIAIHAATVEALEQIGCAEAVVERGLHAKAVSLNDRAVPQAPLVTADFSTLDRYTKYPFALLLPQNVTEKILNEQLEKQFGVQVRRPYKVADLVNADTFDGQMKVTFEFGEVVYAKYVIGADGSHSVVRQKAYIGYADPDGLPIEKSHQMITADVVFDQKIPIGHSRLAAFGSDEAFLGIIPLRPHGLSSDITEHTLTSAAAQDALEQGKIVYRIACQVPESHGTPPSHPPIEYLQTIVDEFGPIWLSSDEKVNPGKPVRITEAPWSTRFRDHSAIASTFFTRLPIPSNSGEGVVNPKGGIVLLVGDAAHIHSPAGGQGMNLGLRDAIGLGPVIAGHIKTSQLNPPPMDEDMALREYTITRHARASATIRLTKRITFVLGSVRSKRFGWLQNAVIRFIGGFTLVKRQMAWRLSGLGNR